MHVKIEKLKENEYLVTIGTVTTVCTRKELALLRVQLNRLSVF